MEMLKVSPSTTGRVELETPRPSGALAGLASSQPRLPRIRFPARIWRKYGVFPWAPAVKHQASAASLPNARSTTTMPRTSAADIVP